MFNVVGVSYAEIPLALPLGRMPGTLSDTGVRGDWGQKEQSNFLFKNLPLQKWQIKGGDPSSSSCLQAMFGSLLF